MADSTSLYRWVRVVHRLQHLEVEDVAAVGLKREQDRGAGRKILSDLVDLRSGGIVLAQQGAHAVLCGRACGSPGDHPAQEKGQERENVAFGQELIDQEFHETPRG